MDRARVGRDCSALECLDALLPPPIWPLLVEATNSLLARLVSTGDLKAKRTYRPTTVAELRKVFFARMDIIARSLPSIDDAFKPEAPPSPPPPPWPSHLSRISASGIHPVTASFR